MTELLEKAFAEASKLSTEEQDAFARWMFEELEDRSWQTLFDRSPELLERLADEAIEGHRNQKRQK